MSNPEYIPEIVPAIELRASYRPSELLRRAIGNLVSEEYVPKVRDELTLRSTIRRVMSEGDYNFESIKDGSVRQATTEFSQLPENRHILFDGKVELNAAPRTHGLMRMTLNARLNRTTLAARDILSTIPSLEDEPVSYNSDNRPRPHAMFVDLPEAFLPANELTRMERLQELQSGLLHPSGAYYVVPQALRALRTRILLKRSDVADALDI